MAYGARKDDQDVLAKWSTKVLRETRVRIIATLRRQARQGGPPSYLMQNAERLYGIRPEEWL